MNCRPGDLAVVVRARLTPEMLGRFVIVEQLCVPGEVLENGIPTAPTNEPAWIIRSAVAGERLPNTLLNGRREPLFRRAYFDNSLRPIRPNEGEDESLSWAKPQIKEPA